MVKLNLIEFYIVLWVSNENLENIKVNLFKFASNIFATKILINCDNKNPTPSPITSEKTPIINVSKNKIKDRTHTKSCKKCK